MHHRWSVVKNLPDNAGDIRDTGTIPGSGGSPGEENGSPFQYSCLGNLLERGAWWATVHGGDKELDMTQQLNNIKVELYSICDWFISLSIMFSRLILAVSHVRISSFFPFDFISLIYKSLF